MPTPVYREDLQVGCVNNPVLGMDAWSEVDKYYPAGEGAKASIVCRFACPLSNACPFGEEGTSIIANGGGWFTNRGVFIKPSDDLMEVHQAAAYIGITPIYFEVLARALGLQRIKSPLSSFVNLVRFEDVEMLAESHGPRHGSGARYDLHLLRGEVPCKKCRAARRVEVKNAGVLRRRVR